MKKRLLAGVLASLMVLGMLTGCNADKTGTNDGVENVSGSDTNLGNENQDTGKIALTVWAEEAQHDTVQKMIDSFIEAYSGEAEFEITLQAASDSDTRNLLLADVQNAADVFSFPDDQLNTMVAAGALAPVPNADEIIEQTVTEAVNAATINGILYAYPMTADNGYFLYYNKKYFKENDVKTLDSILSICEEKDKKFSMELNSGWYLYAFFGNTGMGMGLNDDGITNYCDWNSTEGDITGVDVTKALINIISSPGFVSQPDGSWTAQAQKDEVIAAVSGVWNAMAVRNAWGDDYGACKLPTYTCDGKQIQMASFTGYKMIGVNYYSKNKEWAYKLAQWITNEQNQTLRFVEQNQGPANKVAAASDEVSKVPAITAVIEQSQYGTLQRVGNNFWTPCTEFVDTLIGGEYDTSRLQDMLDKMVKGITE